MQIRISGERESCIINVIIGETKEREDFERRRLFTFSIHLFFPLSSIQPKLIRGRIGKIAINVQTKWGELLH